jgi:hypothetical protein
MLKVEAARKHSFLPGLCSLTMSYRSDMLQQNCYVHAGKWTLSSQTRGHLSETNPLVAKHAPFTHRGEVNDRKH